MTDRLIRLSDVRAIPDMAALPLEDKWPDITGDWEYLKTPEQRAQEAQAATPNTYAWVNLADNQYATPPAPPTISGILYAGRRHVISGPPESTKTLVAYMLLLTALRQEEGVAILDFEMGPHAAATLLRELGATEDELAYIHYTEPYRPPHADDIQRIAGLGVGYTLIDAAAGAYDASGLDDNARKDAEQFASRWIRPLWQAGIATIVIDHVTKNVDTRGKFTIGSERKTGQADVHLSLEALKPLHRGSTGVVKINVHKDRPGHLPRPTVYLVELTSDSDTHQISVTLKAPEQMAEGPIQHTIYAEKISRALEANDGESMSQTQLEEACGGDRGYLRQAATELVNAGYATLEIGPRGAKLFTIAKPFRKDEYDPAGTPQEPRSGAVTLTPSTTAPYIPEGNTSGAVGDGGDDPAEGNDPAGTRVDIYDPDVQALLDEDPDF